MLTEIPGSVYRCGSEGDPLTNSRMSKWSMDDMSLEAPVLQSRTVYWFLTQAGQSGVDHPLSPEIRLGLRNP